MKPASSQAALLLAQWIRANAIQRPDRMTHLKLQKLAFYCYGAALAHSCEDSLGPVEFQAWKHGPVCPTIFHAFSESKSEPIDPCEKPHLPSAADSHMRDVLNVYGRMTAWQLREESHAERPWAEAFDGSHHVSIPQEKLRTHFRAKFTGNVRFPERLFGGSSFALDRLAVPTFRSLHEMSVATSRILGNA